MRFRAQGLLGVDVIATGAAYFGSCSVSARRENLRYSLVTSEDCPVSHIVTTAIVTIEEMTDIGIGRKVALRQSALDNQGEKKSAPLMLDN